MIRSSRLPTELQLPKILPRETRKAQLKRVKQSEFEERATSIYGMCDNPIPIVGNPCDTLTTSKGLARIPVNLLAIVLIGIVLFFDIVGDSVTLIVDIAGDAPIVNEFVGWLAALGLDDVVDVFSMIVMFYFIGPITLVGIPEFADGVVEVFPFWTAMLIIWFLFVRPIRLRDIKRRADALADLGKELEAKSVPAPPPVPKEVPAEA